MDRLFSFIYTLTIVLFSIPKIQHAQKSCVSGRGCYYYSKSAATPDPWEYLRKSFLPLTERDRESFCTSPRVRFILKLAWTLTCCSQRGLPNRIIIFQTGNCQTFGIHWHPIDNTFFFRSFFFFFRLQILCFCPRKYWRKLSPADV